MKRIYEEPEVEVLITKAEDIIMASDGDQYAPDPYADDYQ